MPETTILIGDVRDRIKDIPDDSVNCVVTSPPYFGLRDYGTGTWTGGNKPDCEHVRHQRAKVPQGLQGRIAREAGQREAIKLAATPPEDVHNRYPSAGKAIGNGQFVCELCGAIKIDKQIGLEISPEEYVAAMVEVSREIKRVLRPDGIYWLNIGDSYASTGGNSDRLLRDHARPFGDVKSKDLIGIPWMVAFALRADGWYLRSEIIWGKYAPMPESVDDRPTGAHERIFLLTKNSQYHFDGYAVEDPAVSPNGSSNGFVRPQRLKFGERGNPEPWNGVGGSRNIRSIWMLGPERSPDFHFATFVSEVPRRCILSSLGLKGVCAQCGAPWRRVTKTEIDDSKPRARATINEPEVTKAGQGSNARGSNTWGHHLQHKTLGWEPTCDCNCPDTIPGLVLDPFLGSGTTALVANQLGHDAIGIELNPANAEGARQRIEGDGRFFGRKVYMELGNSV